MPPKPMTDSPEVFRPLLPISFATRIAELYRQEANKRGYYEHLLGLNRWTCELPLLLLPARPVVDTKLDRSLLAG